MEKKKASLANWQYSLSGCITGEVINHPNFPKGAMVETSKIVSFDKDNNTVETLNTIYTLLGRKI